MQNKKWHILFLLIAAMAIALPAGAKSRKEKYDLFFPPRAVAPRLDGRLLEAVEIATLSASRHSHHHCWRAVKDALFEANVIAYRPTSKYAWQAGEELVEKFSFKRLEVSDPFEAPVGSILVYGGPGAGHVEFRSEAGFVSDFANPRPPHRPLLGVYVSSGTILRGVPE